MGIFNAANARPHPDPAGVEPRATSHPRHTARVWILVSDDDSIDRVLGEAVSRGATELWRDHYWAEFNGFNAAFVDPWGNTFVLWVKGGDSPRSPRDSPVSDTRPTPSRPERPKARWTHLALRVADMDATIAWYLEYTPLELLDRREDEDGYGAWLGHPDNSEHPFILVLAQFFPDKDPFAPVADRQAGAVQPLRHRTAQQGRRRRDRRPRRGRRLPRLPGADDAGTDRLHLHAERPDGNLVEFSYDQGVYEKAREVWG